MNDWQTILHIILSYLQKLIENLKKKFFSNIYIYNKLFVSTGNYTKFVIFFHTTLSLYAINSFCLFLFITISTYFIIECWTHSKQFNYKLMNFWFRNMVWLMKCTKMRSMNGNDENIRYRLKTNRIYKFKLLSVAIILKKKNWK